VSTLFESSISFDVFSNKDDKIEVSILNSSGNCVKKQNFMAYNGANNFIIPNLNSLPAGVYVLRIQNREKIVTQKTVRK
jgi:hypothetical protein